MRNFMVHSILVMISCVIAVSPCAYAQGNQWKVEATLAKNQFVLFEPIWLDITLTNTATGSRMTTGLIAPNHLQFFIELKDNAGNPMVYHGPVYDFADGSGHLRLETGEQDYASFDLLSLFRSVNDSSDYAVLRDFPYLSKGSYHIQVLYEGATSKELSFTVIEPSGEEQEALRLIEKASALWNWNNTDPAVRVFRQVVDSFPNSAFAERCYYISVARSMEARAKRMQGPWDFTPVYRAMLSKYPNSGDARGWVAGVTRAMDPQTKNRFLAELVKAHPNSRCAKYLKITQGRLNSQKVGEQ